MPLRPVPTPSVPTSAALPALPAVTRGEWCHGCLAPAARRSRAGKDRLPWFSPGSAVTALHAGPPDPQPQEAAGGHQPAPLTLTVEEAAQQLGIGRTTFYSLISTGEIETVTIGRLRRVPADALPAYIARLRQSQNIRTAA